MKHNMEHNKKDKRKNAGKRTNKYIKTHHLILLCSVLFISVFLLIFQPLLDSSKQITTDFAYFNTNNTLDYSKMNISKITTIEQFNKLLLQNQYNNNNGLTEPHFRDERIFVNSVAQESFSTTSFKSTSVSDTSTHSQISSTNNQIKGVDEADIVKLNENYSFVLPSSHSSYLEIIKLEPNAMLNNIVSFSHTSVSGEDIYFNSMFLSSDNSHLFVFGNYFEEKYAVSEYDYSLYETYERVDILLKIDISTIEDPKVIDSLEFSEELKDARLINDTIYATFEQHSYYNMPRPFFSFTTLEHNDTHTRKETKIISEIIYYDFPKQPKTLTFAALPTQNLKNSQFKTYLIESDSTLFLNSNVGAIVYKNFIDTQELRATVAKKVLLEELEKENLRDVSNSIKQNNISSQNLVLELNNLVNEKEISQDFFTRINNRVNKEYVQEYMQHYTSTLLLFSINAQDSKDEELFNILSKATFQGEILNQFSIDEYRGVIRIATMLNDWILEESRQSGVVTFDLKGNMLDSLYQIAPGEKMYSARFLKDRLYLVTFEQIDPLFVINISNPKDITIEGELKIPGFSEYLHPFKDDLLIGIGKETQFKHNRLTQKGVKVSLFDVSDVNAPKEIDVEVFGNSWGSSLVGEDHRAFVLDESRNFMVVPMQFRENDNEYDHKYWYGAVVLDVSQNGLEEITRLEHQDNRVINRLGYGYEKYNSRILRSTYKDDILYTYSHHQMKSHNISNNFEDIDGIYFDER